MSRGAVEFIGEEFFEFRFEEHGVAELLHGPLFQGLDILSGAATKCGDFPVGSGLPWLQKRAGDGQTQIDSIHGSHDLRRLEMV
jgi:hypothetical protein